MRGVLGMRPALRPALTPIAQALRGLGLFGFSMRSLWSQGEQGAWYDPSDFSSLFQDAAGTTPVTAMEQPVGLVLDKRLGLVRGVEQRPNGVVGIVGTVTAATYNTATGAGSVTRGIDANNQSFIQFTGLNAASFYEVVFDLVSFDAGQGVYVRDGSHLGSITTFTGAGTKRCLVDGPNSGVLTLTSTSGTSSVANVSVREIPGNHATQATTTARPLLSARKNLLLSTEDLRSGGWGIGSGAVITGAKTFSIAATSDSRLQFPAVNCPQGATYSASATLSGTGTVRLEIVDSGGAYMRSAVEIVLTATPTRYNVSRTLGDAAATGMNFRVTGTGTAATVTIDQPQYETGPTATRYQRVNTATDYDWVGFPVYLKFDGVDDNLKSTTGAMTGVFTVLQSLAYDVVGTSTNSFAGIGNDGGYALAKSSGNFTQTRYGTGTALGVAGAANVITAGQLFVQVGTSDGAAVTAQRNNGAVSSVAGVAVTRPTQGFALGAWTTGAVEFMGGRMYAHAHTSRVLSSSELAAAKRTFANKAGVTL